VSFPFCCTLHAAAAGVHINPPAWSGDYAYTGGKPVAEYVTPNESEESITEAEYNRELAKTARRYRRERDEARDALGKVFPPLLADASAVWDAPGPVVSDPFDRVLEEIRALNRSKRADYADTDPWSNFRDAGRQVNSGAGTAVEVLIGTKQSRLRQLLQPGRTPANESVRDSLIDRACYSIIAVALHDAGLYSTEEN
jgi:hypothetical protein